jgi:hypothetical protein
LRSLARNAALPRQRPLTFPVLRFRLEPHQRGASAAKLLCSGMRKGTTMAVKNADIRLVRENLSRITGQVRGYSQILTRDFFSCLPGFVL